MHKMLVLLLYALSVSASGAVDVPSSTKPDYPVPSKLPPHSWSSVGQKLFIHGCNKAGLFNASELALAAKYSIMTVEKGQGLALPGFADGKMEAIAAQWKAARPDGWALFYLNAKVRPTLLLVLLSCCRSCCCSCCRCRSC